ncbi:MAG: hypothetical protein GY906_29920 [bacterium]|nr:hypothetical protein [bacterium]
MNDGLEQAKGKRNFLERLVDMIPGFRSFQERETRREVDKIQRDWLADQVDRVRGELQRKIRDWSRSGNLANLDLASSLEKLLDRLANRIRHADYGYTGVFDAVKIQEDELERLYQFDLALIAQVEGLQQQVETLPRTAAETELRSVLDAAENADRVFDERASVFEAVTQKGAR